MNDRLTQEWIEKVKLDFKQSVDEGRRSFFKIQNQKPWHKKGQKRYEKSEKGKIARKRVMATRSSRLKKYPIYENEKESIKQFYAECPKGYEVDHIISLCYGGRHELSNLQWLAKSIHRRKKHSFYFLEDDYPKCYLNFEVYTNY